MLLGTKNCGFWFTEIKRATINRNSTTGASGIHWLKINTLVCHATPDRSMIRDGFCLSGFWWPDNSHSLFLQNWSKVNITSLYIRLEQKKVISWDANSLWVWRVLLVREGGLGGGEMRLSISLTLQCFQACWLAERVGTGVIEFTDRFMAKQRGTSGIEALLNGYP